MKFKEGDSVVTDEDSEGVISYVFDVGLGNDKIDYNKYIVVKKIRKHLKENP